MFDFDIEDIKDSFSDLVHRNPLLFTVISIILSLFLIGLVILLIQTQPKKTYELKESEPFTADSPILIPDTPDIEKDYYPSRITENQWSEDEINKWFTFPEDDTMAELEKANDKIVEDITGAAP